MNLRIIQFIANMVCLVIIMFMEYKKCHPKKKPLCESCIYLGSKNKSQISQYRCNNKDNWLNNRFEKSPDICMYYQKKEENDD